MEGQRAIPNVLAFIYINDMFRGLENGHLCANVQYLARHNFFNYFCPLLGVGCPKCEQAR